MNLMTASPRNVRRRLARTPAKGVPGRASRRVSAEDVASVTRRRTEGTRQAALQAFIARAARGNLAREAA